MPVVVGTVKWVVDIAQLASEFVVEIVLPASELAVENPGADKAFVAGNWEVVDNLVGRLDNSVVEIVDQAASHFLATVAGNEHVNQVAVNSDHTVELGAATELKVRRLAVSHLLYLLARQLLGLHFLRLQPWLLHLLRLHLLRRISSQLWMPLLWI